MANPYPRRNLAPGNSNYEAYRPSPVQDLNVPSYGRTDAPIPPPHTQYTDNPYSRTEAQPYNDYWSSTTNTAPNTPYSDDTNNGVKPFQPLQPSQSNQDQYAKTPEPYPYVETSINAPTPPPQKPRTLFSRLFNGDQRFAYFCWGISIIQIGVFIGELVKNGIEQHTPIQIQPTFNPLIGPSSYTLINMGARFPPCMHAIPGITNLTENIWPCLNNTANPSTSGPLCSLSDLCGFGGFTGIPDQWFRLIVPIFLHGGILHILFNLLVQLRLGVDMEKAIGTVRFVIVYFTSGIMGFILGANFAGNGIASTGCSGSLFGIIAIVLLDLCYNWHVYANPKRQLIFLLIQVLICFALGLLPGLDNFSHLGGFATGLLLGIAVMRAPPRIRARLSDTRSSTYDLDAPYLDAPYSSLTGRGVTSGRQRGLVGWFKGRKVWWWIWGFIRVACLVLVVVFMALLLNNFYANGGGHCSWCRYLSCLPVNGWCDLGNIKTTTTSGNPSRMFF